MATWSEELAAIQKKRIVRNELERQIYNDRSAIQKIDRELQNIRQNVAGSNPRSERELEQKKASIEQQYRRRAEELKGHLTDLNTSISGIYVDPHPKSIMGQLDDSFLSCFFQYEWKRVS